jgi:hypothetical protein
VRLQQREEGKRMQAVEGRRDVVSQCAADEAELVENAGHVDRERKRGRERASRAIERVG